MYGRNFKMYDRSIKLKSYFYSLVFIICLKYTRTSMADHNLYWESKISFFSKFLGYENIEDFEETLDETNKT